MMAKPNDPFVIVLNKDKNKKLTQV
jgi:hypothetical protein